VRTVDRNGQTVIYTYDSHGLLLTMTLPDGSLTSYAYDAHGNMLTATDANGTIGMTYDTADRMTKISYPGGRSLTFAYDSAGRRTQMVDQSGFTTNYGYDTNGNLSLVTDGTGALIASYTYDALNRLKRQDNGNDTYTTYDYYPSGQVMHIVNYAPDGSVNSRFDYTYDTLGHVATMTTLEGVTIYTYDGDGQLTGAMLPDGRTLTYRYDAAGNRIVTLDSGGTSTGYSTNNLNEYTTINGATEKYDPAGNLMADGSSGSSYTYDALNRLVGVTNAQGTWTFQYNALGQRISEIHNGQQTQFLVDPTGLGNVVGQYSGSGQLIANYTYGLGLTGRVDATNTADYYDFDADGSTAGLTGATGSYVDTYSYLPFGGLRASQGTVANPFQYAGATGVQEDGSGLDYMRARYYDPNQGRFTQPDPLGLAAGSNSYVFSLNNPNSFQDPSGRVLETNITLGYGLGLTIGAYWTGWTTDGLLLTAGPALTTPGIGVHIGYNPSYSPSTGFGASLSGGSLFVETLETSFSTSYPENLTNPLGINPVWGVGTTGGSLAATYTATPSGWAEFLAKSGEFLARANEFQPTGMVPDSNSSTPAALNFAATTQAPALSHSTADSSDTEQVDPATDPNFLSGPAGFGAGGFVTGDAALPFITSASRTRPGRLLRRSRSRSLSSSTPILISLPSSSAPSVSAASISMFPLAGRSTARASTCAARSASMSISARRSI
jgi:RHS repeat-associated protein